MREVLISEECHKFVEEEQQVKKKFLYLLQILMEQKIIHSSFVKKLINTRFYELRISVKNEYRIMIFCCDHENFNESSKAILLNGFIKKNKKDYKKAIKIAEKLIMKYKKECDEQDI